ncbi:hypothetical protein FE392_08700 [Xenorhabdus sp. 12]|uniref:Transmembrane protein n=1 Tax=Xenorhabdus santafensis TaxID=2582833 RepID=A0ABU4S9E9_9GAMM|nr:hypothetical protein [Xenorhabdus sp. 12]MDX7987407.1 hypothetical protein [Xenorhabdus sp. 12]
MRVERLSMICDQILKEDIEILDSKGLKDEGIVESINDETCIIINEVNYNRRWIIISALIGFLLSFGFSIHEFVKTWKGNEKGYFTTLEYSKKVYGDEFYLNPKLPENLKPYKYISNSKSISLPEYLHIRYMDNGFYEKSTVQYNLLVDGGFFIFFLVINSALFYLLFFNRKSAPLVIDRKKRIFYTWEKGRVYVASYSQLEVISAEGALFLRTYGFDENGNLCFHHFWPRTPKLYNSHVRREYLLNFIASYLIKGKAAVSLVNFQRQRMLISSLFLLRQEQKPMNWESQIEYILIEIDKAMPPEIFPDKYTIKGSIQ